MANVGCGKGSSGQARQEDIKDKFALLLKKAQLLGLTTDQLKSLNSVRNLRVGRKHSWLTSKLRWLFMKGLYAIVFILLVMVVIGFVQWPITRQELTAIVFGFERFAFDEEPCLLNVDAPLIHLTRPPVDCAICRGLTSIDRVSRISKETFETKYAYTGRPLVVTDAMENWTAIGTFSFEFFKSIYAEDSPVLTQSELNCQFFPYKSNFQNLSEVFRMGDDRANMQDGSESWYIGW